MPPAVARPSRDDSFRQRSVGPSEDERDGGWATGFLVKGSLSLQEVVAMVRATLSGP